MIKYSLKTELFFDYMKKNKLSKTAFSKYVKLALGRLKKLLAVN